MKTVNQPMRKKDAMQLVTGQPVYMDDVIPQDCLIVKLLRSPHANAIVQEIDTSRALLVPGIEAIYTWKDVDQQGRRYTQAGQTYPEPSPYDRLVIDRHVRFAGDVVAILAGKDEKCVDKAMKLIKVRYEVLPAVLDYHTALDNPVLVHPEENWESLAPVGADNKRNLCAHDESGAGDIEAVLAGGDVVIDHTYHTRACQQAMMETFRTYCSIDAYGRLNVLSSTQIVFHCRRILANALHIPKSMIRVAKPRIGGGFGAKQTSVCEVYPAFVTWKTKKPSKIIFSRYESQIASTPRHEMELHVRLGATKDGIVRGIDLYTLSNTGAYGEHGPTTVGLSGHKSIPLYGKAEAFRFVSDVVYTNHMSAGAYRGYGATQGLFAVESAVNELAHKLNEINAHRQETEQQIFKAAEELLEQQPERLDDRIMLLWGRDWHPGVIGIVASRLVERTGRPVIVVTIDEHGEGKGSGRSVQGFNLHACIGSCADLLVRYGGHAMAAGLSVREENLPELRRRLNDWAARECPVLHTPPLTCDVTIHLDRITVESVRHLDQLAPYGAENPTPVFLLQSAVVDGVYPVSEGRHSRLRLRQGLLRSRAWCGRLRRRAGCRPGRPASRPAAARSHGWGRAGP